MSKQMNKIFSLLKKLDGDELLTEEQVAKYELSLMTVLDECMPQYLFRFRCCNDYGISNFIDERVYLNEPKNFNDPVDSVAYVDPELVMDKIFGAVEYPSPIKVDYDGNETVEPDKMLIKGVEIANYALSAISDTRKRIKVACFSELIDSPLMWSHYADFHKGFAVRYDMKGLTISECAKCNKDTFCHRKAFPFYPVIYKDKRYDISSYAIARALYHDQCSEYCEDDIPVPLIPLIQKGETWKYEKEWRILCYDLDRNYISMNASAIYLGDKITYENAKKLVIEANKKCIPIYKMTVDCFDSKFRMRIDDWTNYSLKDVRESIPDLEIRYGD